MPRLGVPMVLTMTSFLAMAITCGLLLSPAFAQGPKTRMDVDVDDRYLVDKLPKARVDPGYYTGKELQKDFKRIVGLEKIRTLHFLLLLISIALFTTFPLSVLSSNRNMAASKL
jgi:hypothetical protein